MQQTAAFAERVVDTERRWCESIAAACRAPAVILTESTIDLSALSITTPEECLSLRALPISWTDATLFVAAVATLERRVESMLAARARRPLTTLLAVGPLLPGAIAAAFAAAASGARVLAGVRACNTGVRLEIVRSRDDVLQWMEALACSAEAEG